MQIKAVISSVLAASTLLWTTPALAEWQITHNSQPIMASQNLSFPEFSMSPETPHDTTLFGLPVNEGPIDRSLRALIAAGLIGTGIYGLSTGQISTPVSATLLGVATVPTLTAATGYCPLYSLFGVNYTF